MGKGKRVPVSSSSSPTPFFFSFFSFFCACEGGGSYPRAFVRARRSLLTCPSAPGLRELFLVLFMCIWEDGWKNGKWVGDGGDIKLGATLLACSSLFFLSSPPPSPVFLSIILAFKPLPFPDDIIQYCSSSGLGSGSGLGRGVLNHLLSVLLRTTPPTPLPLGWEWELGSLERTGMGEI